VEDDPPAAWHFAVEISARTAALMCSGNEGHAVTTPANSGGSTLSWHSAWRFCADFSGSSWTSLVALPMKLAFPAGLEPATCGL